NIAEWDVERALFPARALAFIAETQPKLWADMRTLHGAGLETLLTDALVKELDLKGSLHVLRHGFKFFGRTFRIAYFKPAHGLNEEVLRLYAQNRLTVTRQVPCHPGRGECGAGNPPHPSGYRTGYLWEEVLQRDSLLDILGSFMFVEKNEKAADGAGGQRRIVTETMVFPRYHQLDAVRKLVATARGEGAGHNYLIQHSAGSGKTNSISWLSHRLASLHDSNDTKIFDCVIVISDRRV